MCTTSDGYFHQGFDRVNLGRFLDQNIQLVGIYMVVGHSYNHHERQVPEEDQSMGAFGIPIQVFPIVSALVDRLYD